jgi:hypothetical protein
VRLLRGLLTSSPPIEISVVDVDLRIVRHQVLLIRRSSPTFDLATAGAEGIATHTRPTAVHVDCVAAPKIPSLARAGTRLIRTQPSVAISDVSVSMALDLLGFQVPVWAPSNPTEVSLLIAEVDDRPKVSVVFVSAAGEAGEAVAVAAFEGVATAKL